MTTRKKVKINVTEEDIAEGRPFDCKACPIALALRRVIKDNLRIQVRDLDVLIEIPEKMVRVIDNVVTDVDIHVFGRDLFLHRSELPESAQTFISDYDAGPNSRIKNPPQPFTFTLSVPKLACRA
jgi:hypothetical protein